MITPTTNHTKLDNNYIKEVKFLSNKLEKDKKTKVNDNLTKLDELQKEKDNFQKEILKLKTEKKSLTNIFAYHNQAKKELKRLTDNQTAEEPRQKNFLGTGTGTKYQTNGWLKQTENHFTPTGTGKLDNIYKIKVENNNFETTEEQIINTIARVVKAFQNVDANDFEAKYNALESNSTKQQQVKDYLKEIQDQAPEIIIGSDKDANGQTKQRTYDFSHNYHKGKFDDNGNWQPNSTDYTQPTFNYQHFFDFLNLVHGQPFLANLDTSKQSQVDKNENWTIFLKGESYKKAELQDYGIVINENKTTLYKVSETENKIINGGQGIKGWLDLAHTITNNNDNLTKLNQAFNNSPTQQLLQDLNSWTQVDGFLTSGTNWTLPESIESMEEVINQLEADKLTHSLQQAEIDKEIIAKNKELITKNSEISTNEKELDGSIKEIIEKLREELNSYEISKGFKDENRRTEIELINLQQLLATIRYLENDGDSNLKSSQDEENTAYDEISSILKKVLHYSSEARDCNLTWYFQIYAYNDSDGKSDIQQAIDRIKAGKYKDKEGKEHEIYYSLETFASHFETKDKLIKLTEWETKAWEALKGEKTPEEKLSDWQSKLKALDPLLTFDIITEDKKKSFEKYAEFKKINQVESLLKKVIENNTLKADFKEIMTKEDAELTDLGNLFKKKEADFIITLIKYYEYEKLLGENDQKKKRRLFSWDREKKENDKFVEEDGDYSVKDDEKADFKKFLFELATGSKKESLITKPTEQNDNPQQKTPETPWWKKGGYAIFWAPTLIIAVGGLLYWKWNDWFGEKDETETSEAEVEEKDDE